MDLIFTLLISPLSLIYEVLFEIIYRMVQSYGAALLLLSVVTSILVIPLDGLVKGAISKEKKIQGIINPQLDKIKREYTGSEKDRAIERLYHRYSYNPVLSYRLALGVLVQLPLLLGAYWMISEFPGIRGASFWFLRDLSEPDGLLFGLNVLPLLMTIINLLIVAVTPNMQRKECIQAGVIAFVGSSGLLGK